MTYLQNLSEEDRAELWRQIMDLLRQAAERRRLETKANRILKRKAIGTGISAVEIRLFRNGSRGYVLADHTSVPKGKPDNVTIKRMIEWLQQKPDKRTARSIETAVFSHAAETIAHVNYYQMH